MLERDVHRTYTHESALTRRMWYSTVTPTDPDMRRVSWGQSAQTTTREVSFALSLVDTHELRRVLNNTEVKERNSTICRHAHVSAFHASSVQLGTCWNVMITVLIHMNLLSPDACGTAQ